MCGGGIGTAHRSSSHEPLNDSKLSMRSYLGFPMDDSGTPEGYNVNDLRPAIFSIGII